MTKTEAWLVERDDGARSVVDDRDPRRAELMRLLARPGATRTPLMRRDPKAEAVLRQVKRLADYVRVNDEWDNSVPGGVRELVDLYAKLEASRKRRAKRGYLKEMRRLMAQREAEAAKVSLRERLHAYKRRQRAKRKAERR